MVIHRVICLATNNSCKFFELANPMRTKRFHLDYGTKVPFRWDFRPMVEMMGFEPMTPCLQGRCSPS